MVRDDSLRRYLALAAEYLVDSRTGIIRAVTELPRQAGDPALFRFVASSARGAFDHVVHTGGAAMNREIALAKAIGEVVERYCAGVFDPHGLPLARARDARFVCVPPSEFALYTAAQHAEPGFPFTRFDDDTVIRWAEATDLASQTPCHVPAGKVYLPYVPDRAAGEASIAQTITTGLASHTSRDAAAINAVCEVIERDAFTIAWQARLAVPRIDPASLGESARELVRRFRRAGAEVALWNLTLDHGVPTILATLRSPSRAMPALVFAAAAELDPGRAAIKSLEELELMRSFAHHVMATRSALVPMPGHDHIQTREDHVQLYCRRDGAALADFLFASTAVQQLDELPDLASHDTARDLRTLVDRISAVGERVLLADITSPDIAELGLCVVRAVIPGFHPLVFGHRLRALGGTRLWRVPQALGHPGIPPATGDNPVPHPFP